MLIIFPVHLLGTWNHTVYCLETTTLTFCGKSAGEDRLAFAVPAIIHVTSPLGLLQDEIEHY